jgi:hypothetical protein
MVMLAELEIRGIPSQAWEQRTAEALLHGSGVVESVDASTMNRYDMSCFKLTAWTHSVEAIPTVRWLAVPEPETGGSLQVSAARRRPRYAAPSMLWYRVRFWFTGVLHTDPVWLNRYRFSYGFLQVRLTLRLFPRQLNWAG